MYGLGPGDANHTARRRVLQNVWDPTKAADLVRNEGVTFTMASTPFLTDLTRVVSETGEGVCRADSEAARGNQASKAIPPDAAYEHPQRRLGAPSIVGEPPPEKRGRRVDRPAEQLEPRMPERRLEAELPCGKLELGSLCPRPLPVFLEEDKGPDHDVLAASGVGGRGRVDTGSMERPARDGAVGHRVIALEH